MESPSIVEIKMDEYLAIDALSSGVCHTLLSQSPAHARYSQTHHHELSTAMDLGTIAHQVLLEGSEDRIAVVDAEDWRTKAAREARDLARLRGATPILEKDMGRVREMAEMAREYIAASEIAEIFKRGKPEQTMLWEENGVACKARPDWLADDNSVIVHFKTVGRSAEPGSFIYGTMTSMGYDIALAFYERGMRAIAGYGSPLRSMILAQETAQPYACSLVALSTAWMEMASVKVERGISLWSECLHSGQWPAYSSRICYAEPRSWQLTQAAEDALGREDHAGYERMLDIAGHGS